MFSCIGGEALEHEQGSKNDFGGATNGVHLQCHTRLQDQILVVVELHSILQS